MRNSPHVFRFLFVAIASVSLIASGPVMSAQSNTYEGCGYATHGGEGGDVYHVTSLEDGGPGSLRDGVFNRSGPRTIVFDVAGTITITNLFKVNSPYLTIDGATAPAPGITLTKDIDWTEFVISGTHDIILRHLRFQGLYLRGEDYGNNDTAFMAIDGDWDPDYYAHDIVIDHVTVLNATDAGLDIWGEVSDVTISWCLIANCFHPSTVSFIPDPMQPYEKRRRISMHHNVWARNDERNPQLRADVADFDYVNNIIYDWGHWDRRGYGVRIRNEPGEPKVDANIVNNYFLAGEVYPTWGLVYGELPGPDQTDGGPLAVVPQGTVVTNSAMGEIWVAGNILPVGNTDDYSTIPAPHPVPTNAQVTTYPALELKDRVVPFVGTKYRTADEQQLLSEMLAAMKPKLRILSVTPELCVLEVEVLAGSRNDLQVSESLEAGAWVSLTHLTNSTDNGISVNVTNAPGGVGVQFYRVITAALP